MSSTFYPLCWCEVGRHAVRENLMHDHDVCVDCVVEKKEGGEANSKPLGRNMKSALKRADRSALIGAGQGELFGPRR